MSTLSNSCCRYSKYCRHFDSTNILCNSRHLLVCPIAWQFYRYNEEKGIDDSTFHSELKDKKI